jgi:hypothetical protein
MSRNAPRREHRPAVRRVFAGRRRSRNADGRQSVQRPTPSAQLDAILRGSRPLTEHLPDAAELSRMLRSQDARKDRDLRYQSRDLRGSARIVFASRGAAPRLVLRVHRPPPCGPQSDVDAHCCGVHGGRVGRRHSLEMEEARARRRTASAASITLSDPHATGALSRRQIHRVCIAGRRRQILMVRDVAGQRPPSDPRRDSLQASMVPDGSEIAVRTGNMIAVVPRLGGAAADPLGNSCQRGRRTAAGSRSVGQLAGVRRC